jgi:DNA-binding MarR family transcriptional regulator
MSSKKFNAEEDKSWRMFLHASTRITSLLDDEMRSKHGERLADFDVLSNLDEAPNGEMRMSELADQTLFSRSRLSYTVSQLESRGLVRRTKDESDRRGVTASLTPAGVALHRRLAVTHLAGIRRVFLDPTSVDSRSDIVNALAPILERLEDGDDKSR